MPKLPESPRGVQVWMSINSAVILALVTWVAMGSFTAGGRAMQMDINTVSIKNIQMEIDKINGEGSTATRARLEDLAKAMEQINANFAALNARIDVILSKHNGGL